MVGRGPKLKGNAFEREVARRLTAWWGKPFHRSPNSGALRWNGDLWTYGDLVPPEEANLIVECKHYATLDLASLLFNGDTCPILGWWKQLQEDVQRAEKELNRPLIGLLVMKANHRPALLATVWSMPVPRVFLVKRPGIRFFLYPFEEFLDTSPPSLFV